VSACMHGRPSEAIHVLHEASEEPPLSRPDRRTQRVQRERRLAIILVANLMREAIRAHQSQSVAISRNQSQSYSSPTLT